MRRVVSTKVTSLLFVFASALVVGCSPNPGSTGGGDAASDSGSIPGTSQDAGPNPGTSGDAGTGTSGDAGTGTSGDAGAKADAGHHSGCDGGSTHEGDDDESDHEGEGSHHE